MKVLHVIDSEGLYGAEVMLVNLAREQKKIGLQPIILNMRESNSFENSLEGEASRNHIPFHVIQTRTGPDFTGSFKIIRYANAGGVDIIHNHGYKPNILLGFIPRRARHLPIVSTIHGWTYTGGNTRMRLYECLDAMSLRFIDAVVLVSKAMQHHPKLKGRKGINFQVIHNGIPISDNSRHSHQPNTPDLDSTIVDFCKIGYSIGSIGRLSTEKGYKYLIEALMLLNKQGIDTRLVIIGDGYERNSITGLIKKFGLENRVMLPGYRDDAKKYMSYFNVFVISSLTEGLPITLLEAMQARVPIVATKVGGIPEVLQNEKCGLLAKPSDPRSLAHALGRIYHDPTLAKDLSSFSYQEALTKYTSENMVLRYLDIYQKLIQHN